MRQRIWRQVFAATAGLLVAGAAATAQAPAARPNAGFTMVYPGQPAPAYQTAQPPLSGLQRVEAIVRTDPAITVPGAPLPSTREGAVILPAPPPTYTGAAIGVASGAPQPKYGYDAYPYPGVHGAIQGLKAGCSNPITCGNFYSDATFIFGSCRQYFGHGHGCGGWLFGKGNCASPIQGNGPVRGFEPCCYDSYLNH